MLYKVTVIHATKKKKEIKADSNDMNATSFCGVD